MKTSSEYTNGEVTIVWKPKLCIHSMICMNGLPSVFRPNEKPWINAESTSTEEIIQQVNRCPSGALSYFIKKKDF